MSKYERDGLFALEEAEEAVCSHIIRVAFASAADAEFDYSVADELWPIEVGQRVEVPFGRKDKAEVGFCVETGISQSEHREAQRKMNSV